MSTTARYALVLPSLGRRGRRLRPSMSARPGLAALVGLLLLTAARAAPAEPARYRFDPAHSFVTFEVLHFGTSTIRGRFGPLQGEVVLDRAQRRARVQVVVDTAGVSTGLAAFDARLREADMLAVQAHPRAYFVAERFDLDATGNVSALRGEFTLRGSSLPLELKALRFNCYTSPLLRVEVCGGDFEGRFERSAAGITHSLPFVADTVRLLVQVEAIRDESR
jgi:polyisoprenoid-binding protein YceI